VPAQTDSLSASAAESEQTLAEINRAISANPQDVNNYVRRAFVSWKLRRYDQALSDCDRVLLLNPSEVRAYILRGHLWEAKKETKKAVADWQTALELDPGHAETYRSYQSRALNPVSAVGAGDRQAQTALAASQGGLTGFLKRLAQYYAEFLSTDFKKQRLPRRQLANSDKKGRLIGIALRKYPGFQQKIWEELAKPINGGLTVNVTRGAWRAALPKAIVEATATHIARVDTDALRIVVGAVMTQAGKIIKDIGNDPDIAFERFCEQLRAELARTIINPLLDRLEGFFERTENKPIESLRELEDQLSARLANGVESASGAAFSAFLVDGSPSPLEAVLLDQLDVGVVRAELEAFFAEFNASDLYVELSDLVRSSRLIDNADFYLHIGEIHHAKTVFPVFYIPFTAERTESGFKLTSDPRFYVNKQAMDYVAQEVARNERRATIASVLHDRIFYLSPHQSPIAIAQKLFDDIAGGFNLRVDIDFKEPRDQKVSSMFVVATNRLSFSLFDRSDESMVNDYEALVTGVDAGSDVVEFFESLIDDFLLTNPISVQSDVERQWDEASLPERLVFDSPLPLVEEQRKILSALRHPESRFIAVEGPPGTGKSHTITAVAFDHILSGKSLMVLSDKKEALDVVEDKLDQALSKVRPTADFPNPILRLGKNSSNYTQLLSKGSIERLLDFIEPISNFTIQLKKHFRSYPEMIGFSSKYFYDDSLQVTKIRGTPIEEVIEFDTVEHDGLIDRRNVNALEARRILDRLTELLDSDAPPSVGIITPHTEQQAFIAKLINEDPRSEELYQKLRLKVMTFDTCQGEEREIIFYSLVATKQKDRLAYVFPAKLGRDEAGEVDRNLRLQRLNVGLSRGQERIVFVHSKPIEQYASSLRVALMHYRSELERARELPTEADLDESSPMERKVLHWLSQVPLIRDLDCEIIAQFEIGKYLKQLDPSYHHPEYRVDFLIRISLDGRRYQMVVEYDGFEFHFEKGVPPGMVNSSTWRTYLTPDDLEREKVLESFGVQMIRLNRFNLGYDPVATIEGLLCEQLNGMLTGGGPHDLVTKLAERAAVIEKGLKSGDYKRCKKCDRDLPLEMFVDANAASGMGRHCRDCKSAASGANKRRFRRAWSAYA
jgi:hypothetical protein